MNLKCHICSGKHKPYNKEGWIDGLEIYCCEVFDLINWNCHSFVYIMKNEIVSYDIQVLRGDSGFILISEKLKNKTLVIPGLGEKGTHHAILDINRYYEPIIENNKLNMDSVLNQLLKLVVFK